MEFQDRVLRCNDCGSDFVWTGGEQAFFADKQFTNEPKRCRACKAKRGPRQAAGHTQPHERVETRSACSACGKDTTVPFRPTQGRPVYCRECFQQRKAHGPRVGS
jgi:CxxC-x17-CxxC domain-containing protein